MIPVTRAEYQRVLEAYAPHIAVASVDAIGVTTAAGVEPVLPYANLTKADGSRQTVDVVWESVEPGAYATPGEFTVKGVAEDDSRMPAEATVTVEAAVEVEVATDSRCVAGTTVLTVKVANAAETAASVELSTPYGSKAWNVAAGKSTSFAFTTRLGTLPGGEVSVNVTQGGAEATLTAAYAARSCG